MREIRKLEVRLEEFLEKEEEYVKELRKCLDKFMKLNENLEEVKTEADPKKVEKLMNLRLETIRALSEALRSESEAKHEKSHLLESYGALILALEEEFKDLVRYS